MNYLEALDYIHSMPKSIKELGNKNLKLLLKELGNPEKKLRFIHVAGTNGKGSVCSALDSVLQEAGLKTGLFTSPFLERFNERIKLLGIDISDDDLSRLTNLVKEKIEETGYILYEFALIFVIAMLYFSEKNVDIVVLEVGLGGRLDATNIIEKSEISIITKIGLDHMQYLGNTKEEIAREKCGIIKENGRVLVYPEQEKSVLEVIKNSCKEKNASLYIPQMPQEIKDFEKYQSFKYKEDSYKTKLHGTYQPKNLCVSIECAKILGIKEDAIFKGIENATWNGRFEWISDKLLIDGCHNEDGALELQKSLSLINEKKTIVLAAMEDKATDDICKIISEITDNIIVTRIDYPRCEKPENLKAKLKNYGIDATIIENPELATQKALGNDGICVVCGSLYLIGEIRTKFKKGGA